MSDCLHASTYVLAYALYGRTGVCMLVCSFPCVYMHVYTHTYIYMIIYIYICVCICVYAYVFLYVRMYVRMYVHLQTYLQVCCVFIYVYMIMFVVSKPLCIPVVAAFHGLGAGHGSSSPAILGPGRRSRRALIFEGLQIRENLS